MATALQAAVARRRAQLLQGPAADARGVRPSVRRLAHALERGRESLERVPLLRAGRADLLAVAAALDGAEALALAVEVDAPEELLAVLALSEARGLPLLRTDLVLEERQLVESRAAGFDAVLLRPALLGPALAPCAGLAHSMHMACVALVEDEAGLDAALAARADALALPLDAGGRAGALLAAAQAKARRLPLVALPQGAAACDPQGSLALDLAGLLGRLDAALDPALALLPDPAAALRAWLEAG